MKRLLALFLVLVLCLGLVACSNSKGDNRQQEIALSKEDLIESATVVKADEITKNIGGNIVRAEQYEGKIYQITGHIFKIASEYAIIVAAQVDTDSHQHSHSEDWYAFGLDTVFHVYFDADTLANLNLCDNIEFVGEITMVNSGTYNAIKDQIQVTVDNAYLIGSADYQGTYLD